MEHRIRYLAALGALALAASGPPANAEITFIGPFPYRSAADSPFDLSGLGSTFFLEDFEDFDFDETPGIFGRDFGVSIGPSVDGDDGVVDGQMSGIGFAAQPSFGFNSTTTYTEAFGVYFNSIDLGSYPTAFGMVFTEKDNSPAALGAFIGVYDYDGTVLASMDLSDLYSDGLDATDDLFIGIVSSDGLPTVGYEETFSLLPSNGPPRLSYIDHLQYGLLVPEPSGLALLLVACFLIRCASALPYRT